MTTNEQLHRRRSEGILVWGWRGQTVIAVIMLENIKLMIGDWIAFLFSPGGCISLTFLSRQDAFFMLYGFLSHMWLKLLCAKICVSMCVMSSHCGNTSALLTAYSAVYITLKIKVHKLSLRW